jgi:hypothetical protein
MATFDAVTLDLLLFQQHERDAHWWRMKWGSPASGILGR